LLSEILKESYIQLNVTADTFEEAIIKATSPLVNDKVITEQYVEKILSIYEETGPYIVITKHVALPHAPSDAGALKTAIGITTLAKPVISGHETNDPVKYLLALSASDGKTHLKALSELVGLLSDPVFFEQLASTDQPQEIINYIKQVERNEEDA
jgi:mannitol/fructose-specific phosphotransferase system IIA component (Ntr-type)